MTRPIVFYSWQSDLPRKSTRDIIHSAATKAIGRLAAQLSLEDAPRLDHDTLSESGAPAIAETIYDKIKRSAIFVADVTFIGESYDQQNKKKKLLSNPNVLLELGYASAALGWKRVILVMNKTLGPPEELPFDLRNRRFPITFSADKDHPDKWPKTLEGLTGELETAIAVCLSDEYQRVEDTLERLPTYARRMMQRLGAGQLFSEGKTENSITSHDDLGISLLLELRLIRCVAIAAEPGLAYEWTYLGRQCLLRLGIVPFVPQIPQRVENRTLVEVNTPFYDSLKEPNDPA